MDKKRITPAVIDAAVIAPAKFLGLRKPAIFIRRSLQLVVSPAGWGPEGHRSIVTTISSEFAPSLHDPAPLAQLG